MDVDLARSLQDYKEGLGAFRSKLRDVGETYLAFTSACFQPGAVAVKDKHLTALGIAIYAQDEYCILYHTDNALESGATEQEILETVGVAAAFGGGAALAQGVTLVQRAIAELGRDRGSQGH